MKKILEKKYIIIQILFSTLISWLAFHVAEEEFEVPRYYWLYLTTISVLIYIGYLRGIKIYDVKSWIFLIVGTGLLIAIWEIRGISAANYGEEYSMVLKLRHSCYVLFAGLLIDLIRNRPTHIKNIGRSPLFWLWISFSLVGAFFVHTDIIPLLIPMVALVLTKIEPEKWTELMDCFGIGYYLVFLKMFTGSLLATTELGIDGRYLGVFANISTTGIHVSIAVLWGLYFFIRWLWSTKDIRKLVVLLILWIYPIIVSFMVNSRSAEFGLLGALLVSFVFLHGKGIDSTKKRMIIGIVVCIAGLAVLVSLGYILTDLQEKKMVGHLSYGLDHIALLGQTYENGYFNSQLLNKINALSSQRLIDWVELIRQADFVGVTTDKLYSHNVFVFYIIEYGFIGGGLVIAWAITYIIWGAIQSLSNKKEFIMPLIYGTFAFLSEIGMNGYWMLPLGIYWLLLSYPLLTYRFEKNCLIKDMVR